MWDLNGSDRQDLCGADVFAGIVDRSRLGVAVFGPVESGRDFLHLYTNAPCQALKPFRPMTGRTYSEVWPELAAFALPRFAEVLETGVPWVERGIPLGVETEPGVTETHYYDYEISRLDAGGETLLLDVATEVTAEVEARVEGRRTEEALRESEAKYRNLFTNLIDGFALHEIVLDERGEPADYVFLEVNRAFEKLSGLKAADIVGKRVTEVLPGIENDPADWIGRYGRVATTGETIRFEQYAELLDKWYAVSAYRPQRGRFVTVFDDITSRKHAEEERERLLQRLEESLRQLRDKDRGIRQAYSDVIDAVTGGRLIILGRDELDRALVAEKGKPYEIRSPSQLSEARARVHGYIGDVPDVADLLVAFSEGATNMLKHAGGGVYRVCKDERRVQLVLQDEGPGIDFRNLPKATLVPGFSTGQTLGMGFTLMMELTDRLLLCTDAGGTMLLLEKDLRPG